MTNEKDVMRDALAKQLGDDVGRMLARRMTVAELQTINAAVDDMANRCIQLGVRSVRLLVETERLAQGGGA